jgi:molybdopterin-dependent oxidoreductase alpha subunit
MAIFGIGHQKPHHYREMARAVWENRDQLPFAWRILRDGVCDGCALGTSGLSDWTVPGTHLCMVRLELMRLNTAPAFDPAMLIDVDPLTKRTSAELRALGRLSEPMIRRRGARGFEVVSWDAALDRIAAELRTVNPSRLAFYLTSRGTTNEVYYAAQKAARFFGTNHVDNSARLCHAASTVAMKAMLGHGASTCSYLDWLHADLIVLFGSNAANNQPVATKYLHYAKKNGARVAVVNPYREPGLARYWIPSIAGSALTGTPLADYWFDVNMGGDRAFLIGVMRSLVELGGIDEAFVRENTTGFEAVRAQARASPWEDLEHESGATRERMLAFARLLIERPNAVFIWSMGLTQHVHGVETIKALVNVGLARGLPGRPNRGLVPIRGHSGVQGGAEVGCAPRVDGETASRWTRLWEFPVPAARGWSAAEMVERAASGEIDVWWSLGGNFLETLAGIDRSREALRRVRLRVHQDIVLSSSMLAGCDGEVLLLPAATRYESPGGGTETSTERRIIYSPEIPGRRVGSAMPEWWVFGEVMARARPEQRHLVGLEDAHAIREEIARAVPLYTGIEALAAKGDYVQWGGRTLYADGRFATPDGKARFAPVSTERGPAVALEPGSFAVSTRRGKQFNSMVQREVDPLTGAPRHAILINQHDLDALGAADGASARLESRWGAFTGTLRAAPIKRGNVEVHWPEGNSLLSPSALDPDSLEPDYNAVVRITILTDTAGASRA